MALVAAGALLTVLAVVGFALQGDEDDGSGALSWVGEPRVSTPERLPEDQVLTGRVQNDSLRTTRLVAREIRLVDGDGRMVPGRAVFVDSFLHGLYPPTREPSRLPESELRRTGRIARIEPGKSVPLTVSWRLAEGSKAPVRVDYGSGTLPIP